MVDDDSVGSPTAQLELPLIAASTSIDERRSVKPLRREWTPELLGRHFLLSETDMEEAKRSRGAENRLGFALTLLLIRFLNFVPVSLEHVPDAVVDFVSSQVGVEPDVLVTYGKRRPQTRDDHAKRIRRYLGVRAFVASDGEAQAAVAAEVPLDKTVNTRIQAANASGVGLGDWVDEQHSSIPNSPHSTAGVRLSWKASPAEYRSDTGGISHAPEDVFALRLAQFFEDNALNPVALPADLFVVLSDGTEEALVRLGAVAQIPYPDATVTVLSMMRTVRLPLDAFQAANPALNLSDIRSATLRFMARPGGSRTAGGVIPRPGIIGNSRPRHGPRMHAA